MPKRFYLETSVIRSRFIGHSSIREPLKQKLKNKIRVTSKFVKMEFNRSLICDLIEFYFVLSRSLSISDAIKYWTEDFRIRKIKNINLSISDFFNKIDDDYINLGLLRLRNLIKNLTIEFNCLIHRFEQNNTNCYLGDFNLNFKSFSTVEEIERELARFHDYYRKNYVNNCNIVSLFIDSKETLDNILQYNSKKDNFKKQQEEISKIQNKEKKLSCSTCKSIGDIFIALECPEYAILLTLDTIFEDLCQILGLKFEVMQSVRRRIPIKSFKKKT